MSRAKTPQGVLVRVQGKEYQAYCNECPWVSHRVRRNMGNGQKDARRHARAAHREAVAA